MKALSFLYSFLDITIKLIYSINGIGNQYALINNKIDNTFSDQHQREEKGFLNYKIGFSDFFLDWNERR